MMKVCHALARLGHSVHLLVPGQAGVNWEMLADRYGLSAPFEITWLRSHPRLKHNDFAWLAVRRAAALGANLIYTWTGQSAVFALLQGFPLVFEVHDLPTGRFGPLWYYSLRRLPGKKRFLITTQALLKQLEKVIGPIPAEQVRISGNGVDLDAYAELPAAPQARKSLGLPEQVTVLCAGHLYAGRGVDLFLGLAARFKQAHFIWVGGRAEDVALFRAQAEESGLNNVLFTGFLSQRRLPLYQAAADILLMPYARSISVSGGGNSADICSPMKMFDYLAAGRAILSSDLPVIHEVLNETNAVFAPPEDLEGWTAALGHLLADETLRLRLSAQACQDAARYTWLVRAEQGLAGFAG